MIMKNLHINMAFIFVLLLITASCSDGMPWVFSPVRQGPTSIMCSLY